MQPSNLTSLIAPPSIQESAFSESPAAGLASQKIRAAAQDEKIGFNRCKKDYSQIINTQLSEEESTLRAHHFSLLNFDNLSTSERLCRLKELASQDYIPTVVHIIRHIDTYGIKEASLEERLKLFRLLISKRLCAFEAVKQIHLLKLEEATVEQRLEIYKLIAEQGDFPCSLLLDRMDFALLSEATAMQRIELYILMAKQGYSSSDFFVDHIERLHLKDVCLDKRLILYNIIAQNVPVRLFCNFKALQLEAVNDDQFLQVYRSIFRALGPVAGDLGIERIDLIELENISDPDKMIEFVNIFAAKDTVLRDRMISRLRGLPLSESKQRQLFLEDLIPPLAQSFGVPPYAKDISPIVEILACQCDSIDDPEKLKNAANNFKAFLLSHPKWKFIHDTLSRIQEETAVQFKLTQWLAYAAGVLSDAKETYLKSIEDSGLLSVILQYQSPPHRYTLVRLLSIVAAKSPADMLSRHTQKHWWCQIAWIPLARLKTMGMQNRTVENLLNLINKRNSFEDTKRFNDLLNLLLDVVRELPNQEQLELIGKSLIEVLDLNRNIDQITSDLRALDNSLTIFGWNKFLKYLSLSTVER